MLGLDDVAQCSDPSASTGPVLNQAASFSFSTLGEEKTPVLVMDNCLVNPDVLVSLALQIQRQEILEHGSFSTSAGDFYPGVRCNFSASFGAALIEQLAPVMKKFFLASSPAIDLVPRAASLSIAGVRKETLRPIQSLPHFDDTHGNQYALVLYLFDGDFGGTGFYRHISTGFERIGADRLAEYAPRLKAEAMQHRELLFRYPELESPLFSSTGSVSARFNRAVIYPSNCLHSGLLNNEFDYALCAEKGRLTANLLFLCNEVR